MRQAACVETCERRVLLSVAADAVLWSTYVGTTGHDETGGIAVTSDGSVIAGINASPVPEASEAWIAKVTGSGELIWRTLLGVNSQVRAVAVDAEGNVFAAGATQLTLPQATNPRPGTHDSNDAFVAKFSADGQVIWSTHLGGSGGEGVSSLLVSDTGQIYAAGTTRSTDFAGAANAYGGGATDGFVVELSDSGALQWATYLGGAGRDTLTQASLDPSTGAVVVVGITDSQDLPNRIGASPAGAFAARLLNDGSLAWTMHLGSGFAARVATDQQGESVVAVNTLATSDGANPRADAYLVKLAEDGAWLWRTDVAGSGDDRIDGLVFEPDGSVLIAGTTRSPDLPRAIGQLAGDGDGFVGRLSSHGELAWTLYVGTESPDAFTGIALNPSGEILLIGGVFSDHFPARTNERHGNSRDIIVAKLDPAVPEALAAHKWILATSGDDTIHISATTLDSQPAVIITINGVAGDAFIPTAPIEIHGLAGNDRITVDQAVSFAVVLYGGDGDDTLAGGSGHDLIFGGAGHDLISGGAGNDTLYGNLGSDTIGGGTGDDQLFGGLGRDVLTGGAGNDSLTGGNGTDLLRGGAGHDHLNGKGKSDTLYGGDGNDTLIGGAGADLIFGDAGDDLLDAGISPLFQDTLHGGNGHDRYTADEDDLLSDLEELL